MTVGSWLTQTIWSPIAIALTPDNKKSGNLHWQKTIQNDRWQSTNWIVIAAIFAVFALTSATAVPGVNETHYLTKAKHFWDSDWCGNDLFLSSSDAHFAFFAMFGWPTLFISLDAYAWICLLYTSPSPRDATLSRMPSSA